VQASRLTQRARYGVHTSRSNSVVRRRRVHQWVCHTPCAIELQHVDVRSLPRASILDKNEGVSYPVPLRTAAELLWCVCPGIAVDKVAHMEVCMRAMIRIDGEDTAACAGDHASPVQPEPILCY
jgi:hypothetical protein